MATFVKLTNGDIVNTQHIKSIKRHEHMSARAVAVFLRENQENKRMETQPSIELQLGSDPNPLLLKYESEQERDSEFGRIEAILIQPRPTVTFGSLMFDPTLVQLAKVDWKGFDDSSLGLRIKMPGQRLFVIGVDRANQVEWEQCMTLLTQFSLSPPAVPEW